MRRTRAFATLLLAAACRQLPHVETSDDFEEEWRAARDRVMEANLVLLRALAVREDPTLRKCLDAEDDLDKATRDLVLAHTDRGTAHAEAAVRLRPDRVEGHLALGLNLALGAVPRGSIALLLGGVPGRIRQSYERALELDRTFGDGSALGLKGRFLTRAPPPWRARAAARAALEESLAVAPSRMGSLFLGDACEELGDREAALRAWRTAAEGTPATEEDRLVAVLAQERLLLAEADPK